MTYNLRIYYNMLRLEATDLLEIDLDSLDMKVMILPLRNPNGLDDFDVLFCFLGHLEEKSIP